MKLFTKVGTVLGLGLFFLTTVAFSAPLFSVDSNGNYLTVTTTSTKTLNVGIKSTGFSFSNCTLDTASGYCRFTLNNTQSQNLLLAGPATQPVLSLCTFSNRNAINTCQTVNLAERFAYVVNYTGFSVSLCPIDSSTGALGTCTMTLPDPTFLAPMGIALNPKGTFAYVTTRPYNAGGPNSTSVCPINSDGSYGQCSLSTAYFKGPWFLTLNAQGTKAYVANGFTSPPINTISTCSIDTTDGTIASCTSFSDPTFNVPVAIKLNSAGTLAYVTNTGVGGNGVNVSLCPVNTADGSLRPCVSMTDPTFQGPAGITLNSKGTIAYVANYQVQNGATVSLCPINTRNGGIFKPCTALNSPVFSGPIGITLNKAGTFAYITENKSNQVSVCPINADGTFGTCKNSETGPLNQPGGIVLY